MIIVSPFLDSSQLNSLFMPWILDMPVELYPGNKLTKAIAAEEIMLGNEDEEYVLTQNDY